MIRQDYIGVFEVAIRYQTDIIYPLPMPIIWQPVCLLVRLFTSLFNFLFRGLILEQYGFQVLPEFYSTFLSYYFQTIFVFFKVSRTFFEVVSSGAVSGQPPSCGGQLKMSLCLFSIIYNVENQQNIL